VVQPAITKREGGSALKRMIKVLAITVVMTALMLAMAAPAFAIGGKHNQGACEKDFFAGGGGKDLKQESDNLVRGYCVFVGPQ
jgi:hypothetical protein